MLHACFVRSPFARAAIRGIDTSAALRRARGALRVHRRRPEPGRARSSGTRRSAATSPETPRPPLAEGEVRFVGDPVALVVAESRYLAEDAAELVEVDYEPLPAVVDYTEAEHADALVHESHGSNVIGEIAGLPASALEDGVRRGRPRGERDDLPAGVRRRCRWKDAAWSSTTRARPAS